MGGGKGMTASRSRSTSTTTATYHGARVTGQRCGAYAMGGGKGMTGVAISIDFAMID